jgi:hypothetical protein
MIIIISAYQQLKIDLFPFGRICDLQVAGPIPWAVILQLWTQTALTEDADGVRCSMELATVNHR